MINDGMTPTVEKEKMDFFDALRKLNEGKRIASLSWLPSADYGVLRDGWLTIFTKGDFHLWKVRDADMNLIDWVVLPDLH